MLKKKRKVKKSAPKSRMAGRKRGGASYPCPDCNSDSEVIITRRESPQGPVVRRRRCLACTCEFVTEETVR